MNKTAIVIGATGLVGSHLVQLLLMNDEYKLIKIFSRRSLKIESDKIKEFIVDFDDISSFKKELSGDVLFSTMGTTIKSAGSKEAQYKVDYTYQNDVAIAAAENGVKKLVLVSSAGANSKSRFFYMKMKGQLDDAVKLLGFKSVVILRPATLDGDRNEHRAGEKAAIKITDIMSKLIPGLKKYRPIHASIVANAMIKAAGQDMPAPYQIYTFNEVFQLENH